MISWVNQCFDAWGEWIQNNRGQGSKGLSASWDSVSRASTVTSYIPIQSLECSRLHDWVSALPDSDKRILAEVYCTSRTSVDHARHLKMSTRTLYAKLHTLQSAYATHCDDRRAAQKSARMGKK